MGMCAYWLSDGGYTFYFIFYLSVYNIYIYIMLLN